MPLLLVLWLFLPFYPPFWGWESWATATLVAAPFLYIAASSLIHRVRFGNEPTGPMYGPPTYTQHVIRQAMKGA